MSKISIFAIKLFSLLYLFLLFNKSYFSESLFETIFDQVDKITKSKIFPKNQ